MTVTPDAGTGSCYYTVSMPPDQQRATMTLTSSGGAARQFVVSSYCNKAAGTAPAQCEVADPPSGTYYVRVDNTAQTADSYTMLFTTERVQTCGTSSAPIPLTIGSAWTGSFASTAGGTCYYTVSMLVGQQRATMNLTSSTGATRRFQVSQYCDKSAGPAPASCEVADPPSGTWYVQVTNTGQTKDAFTILFTTASVPTCGTSSNALQLTIGTPWMGSFASTAGGTCYYTVEIPVNQQRATMNLTSSSGATRRFQVSQYCDNSAGPAPANCEVADPPAGTWYVRVTNTGQTKDAFTILFTTGSVQSCGTSSSPLLLIVGMPWTSSFASKAGGSCYYIVAMPPNRLSATMNLTSSSGATRRLQVSQYCDKTAGPAPASCEVADPPTGTWYVRVTNLGQTTDSFTILFTTNPIWVPPQNCGSPSAPQILSNGIQLSSFTPGSAYCYYAIDVPADKAELRVDENNPTGYTRELLLTKTAYNPAIGWKADECHQTGSSAVLCEIAAPAAQRWWIAVRNNDASDKTDAFTIKATFDGGSNCNAPSSPFVLTSGVETNAAPAGSKHCYFAIDVPAGKAELRVDETNPTGYTRELIVTKAPYNPAIGWRADECHQVGSSVVLCRIDNPAAQRWWIAIRNNDASGATDVFTIRAAPLSAGAQAQTSFISTSPNEGAYATGHLGGQAGGPTSRASQVKTQGKSPSSGPSSLTVDFLFLVGIVVLIAWLVWRRKRNQQFNREVPPQQGYRENREDNQDAGAREPVEPENSNSLPPFLEEVIRQDVTFDDVIGLETAKQELAEAMDLIENPRKQHEFGIQPTRGIILHGPPGNGKTKFAKAAAGQFGKRFLSVQASHLGSKWHYETKKQVHAMFAYARKHTPCILFIDDADQLLRDRKSAREAWQNEAVEQFLSELDGIQGKGRNPIVICATNHLDFLDSGVTRPGRLGCHIKVPNPDLRARAKMFDHMLGKSPLGRAADIDIGELAKRTDGKSGAEIEAMVTGAAQGIYREAQRGGRKRPIAMRDLLPSYSPGGAGQGRQKPPGAGRPVPPDSHYGILGIPFNSTADVIRQAYRDRILVVHPDKHAQNPSKGGRAYAASLTLKLNLARDTLLDPARRAAYDRELGL